MVKGIDISYKILLYLYLGDGKTEHDIESNDCWRDIGTSSNKTETYRTISQIRSPVDLGALVATSRKSVTQLICMIYQPIETGWGDITSHESRT